MQYKVLREHIGDKFYMTGDVREAEQSDVAHLVRSGCLKAMSETDFDTISLVENTDTVTEDAAATPADLGAVTEDINNSVQSAAEPTQVEDTHGENMEAEKKEPETRNKAEGRAPKNKGE